MESKKIPNSLFPQLNEIAERLWSGHAAIMIGAGFSRNAMPLNGSSKGFPDWNALGKLFYEKTRGEKLQNGQFFNPLKLADEVEASFGRPALHQLLRDAIPDNEYEPSDLHIDLLNLPWSDVLTTNYDTLLERAAQKVTDYNYQIVINDQNLIYSEKPRIIKLHGSFPSTEPFIITEEDYRCYPNQFAPFVNTVQQSLLENTLCLIGFSGDDPNFLRWIGWIRDNLGENNSPKIYMIGVLNLTKAQTSLLSKYNIVPVDMSELDGIDRDNHRKGIREFLSFCANQKEQSDNLDWPRSNDELSAPNLNTDESNETQVKAVIEVWKVQRESYPGWLIVPYDRRDELYNSTYHWERFLDNYKDFSKNILFEFIYEFCWRMEKCLCPIWDSNVPLIEISLNWAKEQVDNDSDVLLNSSEFETVHLREIKEKSCFLVLVYMRYLREEGKFDLWKEKEDLLSVFLSKDTERSQYQYEKCLFSLFKFDIPELKKRLTSWLVSSSQPYWAAKKAGLMAEMGDIEESLNSVRSRINIRPITIDYTDVSQESYILFLLQYVKIAKAYLENKNPDYSEFSDRWNILKQYKCDPWLEQELFEKIIDKKHSFDREVVEENFDIGRVSKVLSLGSGDKLLRDAFGVLKFSEDIGIPFKILNVNNAQKSALKAIELLEGCAQNLCLVTMLRIGNKDMVDKIFNRKSICKMRYDEVDLLVVRYVELCEKYIFSEKNMFFGMRKKLRNIIPELFSRLVVKCSPEKKSLIFGILKGVYSSDDKSNYYNVDKFAKRFVSSLSENELIDLIPDFVRFKPKSELNLHFNREFPNPFNFTYVLDENFVRSNCTLKNFDHQNLIAELKHGNESIRDWCITTLLELNRFKVLSKLQFSDFVDAVWSNVDKNGFPISKKFYKFVFCCSLGFKNEKRIKLIKDFILKQQFSIFHKSQKNGVRVSLGNMSQCDEIKGVGHSVGWSCEESYEIFSNIIQWWDSDKISLNEYKGKELVEEIRAKFENIGSVLSQLLSKNLKIRDEKDFKVLMRLASEMKGYDIPVCELICATYMKEEGLEIDIIGEISSTFLDLRSSFVANAINGLYILFKNDGNKQKKYAIQHYYLLMSNVLLSRDKVRLLLVLHCITLILKDYSSNFTENLASSVIFSLEKLVVESNGTSKLFTLNESLHIREMAASVAFLFYRYCKKEGRDIPAVLYDWEKICQDPNEFVEIRNAWVY